MFLFKSLPQGLFRSEDPNSNKLTSHCCHAVGLGLRDTIKFSAGRNGDRKQTSDSECTKVKWRFSELLSDGSHIWLKISEVTSTNFTTWNDRTCRWVQIWRKCSYYEFARECKFIWYCINRNTTLNLLLKARIKSTPLNLQTVWASLLFFFFFIVHCSFNGLLFLLLEIADLCKIETEK